MLASLHAAVPEQLGLAAGEPVYSPLDELNRWRATARAAGEQAEAESQPLLEALERTLPTAAQDGFLGSSCSPTSLTSWVVRPGGSGRGCLRQHLHAQLVGPAF